MDSKASHFLILSDMASRVCRGRGRAFVVKSTTVPLITLSGHPLEVEGIIELEVPHVDPISCTVVRNMGHEAIIGWDQLHRHGWAMEDSHSECTLRWGQAIFRIDHFQYVPSTEIALMEAGCLTDVLIKHRAAFGEPGKLPAAALPAFTIKTEDGVIVAQRSNRAPLLKRKIIDEEVDKMLAMGIIRPSNSPWSSPVTLVPKKDGMTCFCVDYRKLNDVTIKDRYPLPHIQEIFDMLGGSQIFSTMDMRSGYWQVPVEESSIPKTSFVCFKGQYEFLRLPFGVCNAPSMYQRIMNTVLAEYIGKFVLCFFDDCVVYSKTEEEHKRHVDLVLTKFS